MGGDWRLFRSVEGRRRGLLLFDCRHHLGILAPAEQQNRIDSAVSGEPLDRLLGSRRLQHFDRRIARNLASDRLGSDDENRNHFERSIQTEADPPGRGTPVDAET
jgi:hypothetical protein